MNKTEVGKLKYMREARWEEKLNHQYSSMFRLKTGDNSQFPLLLSEHSSPTDIFPKFL